MNSLTIDSEAALTRVVDRLQANWKQHAKRGSALVVTIENAAQPRTEKQLRRYWKLLRMIAEHAAPNGQMYLAEYWDEWYRGQLIGVDECDGERVALSASGMSIGEFNDYMRQIESHAVGELGIELDMR